MAVQGANGYNYGYNYMDMKSKGSEKASGNIYEESASSKQDKALAKKHGLDYDLIMRGQRYESWDKKDQSSDSSIKFNAADREDYDKAIAEWNKFSELKSEAKDTKVESAKQQTETYKPDFEKINQMKSDLKGNMAAFKQMVYSQIKDQGLNANSTLADILKGIQGMNQEEAAKAVADDGEWGVDATANRILDFAIALSGGDPSKIGTLRDAVQKGFDAAGKVWGGDLPEISHKTLEKVMAGFDEWEKSGSAANVGSNAQAQANAASQVMA